MAPFTTTEIGSGVAGSNPGLDTPHPGYDASSPRENYSAISPGTLALPTTFNFVCSCK